MSASPKGASPRSTARPWPRVSRRSRRSRARRPPSRPAPRRWKSASTATARTEAVEAANRKLIFETVLSDDKAKFARGKDGPARRGQGAIDQMVAQLKSQKSAIWVEIEGHTDNTGDAAFNQALGLARAEAVKRYLYEQHQVPLHKMNAISFGEEKPVMDNKTRDNREQNRRVVIKVLA